VWDGRDESGQSVTSGIYFYRIKVNSFVEKCKMIFIK
jgi:hypothetical protein